MNNKKKLIAFISRQNLIYTNIYELTNKILDLLDIEYGENSYGITIVKSNEVTIESNDGKLKILIPSLKVI